MQRDSLPAQAFVEAYREACRQTDDLFDRILPEFLTVRPVSERHRMLFYIGHLEAFDWNLLSGRVLHQTAFNAEFDQLFAFGIDPVGGGLPTDQPEDWPSMAAIHAYRDEVRKRIENAIPDVDFSHSTHSEGAALLHVVIEHRQMHAETLAYLLHQMPVGQKQAPEGWARSGGDGNAIAATGDALPTSQAEMRTVPAGRVMMGLRRADGACMGVNGAFGWDNEFGEKTVDVPAFQMDTHMVSNGEFMAFVEAGGYDEPRYWATENWAWHQKMGLSHPVFWARQDGVWMQRTMFDLRPLPLDWPVYVSHAEASAYATFRGKRLPTEAQWLRAAEGAPPAHEVVSTGNFDFRDWNPQDVRAWPDNRSQYGVHGQFGNGWEWTSDTFAPFPGFEAFSFYPGYSADFFDERHFVMKGGSPRTAARMLRPSFRNWFQPHYPYVYVGLRCIRDLPESSAAR